MTWPPLDSQLQKSMTNKLLHANDRNGEILCCRTPIHNGGGVGIGYLLHVGQVQWTYGTETAKCSEGVQTTDPGTRIVWHVDTGTRGATGGAFP